LWLKGEPVRTTLPQLNSDALFGALVVALIVLDGTKTGAQTRNADLLKMIPSGNNAFLSMLRCILSARGKGASPTLLSDLFKNCSFSAVQKRFIESWVNREIRLVEWVGTGRPIDSKPRKYRR
jgi:hypothetical protein